MQWRSLPMKKWIKMREGEDEIGWMLSQPPAKYPEEEQYVHPSEDKTIRTDVSFDENASHFDEGYMTVEQVNLLFRTLPLDLTYVDENDRVIFYNRGDIRVFPRSAGIIGREVRFAILRKVGYRSENIGSFQKRRAK